MTPKPPKTPPGIEPRWHAGRQVWTYRVRYKDPATGRRLSEEADSIQDAEDFQAYLRLARRTGVLADMQRGRVPLSEFALQHWAPAVQPTLAPATVEAYRITYARHLHPHIGHLELRDLTPPVIDQLAEQLAAADVGTPTIRKTLAVLQSICAFAVRRGELVANPVREVRKPAARRTAVIRPLSIEEIEALLTELKARADYPAQWMLAELIAYTGARPQDALALTYDRIGKQRLVYNQKNNNGVIVAGAKTGSERVRSVALLAYLRRDLLAYRSAGEGHSGLVLPDATGAPWKRSTYQNWRRDEIVRADPNTGKPKTIRHAGAFAAAAKAIGREDATPYFLRHSYASIRLAEQRLSLQEIAQEMGHTVEILARTYSHVISEYAGRGPIDPDTEIARIRSGRPEAGERVG